MSNCNDAFNEIEEIENMENITYAVLSIENNVFGLVRAGLGDSNDISESSLFSDAVLYVFKREQANLDLIIFHLKLMRLHHQALNYQALMVN